MKNKERLSITVDKEVKEWLQKYCVDYGFNNSIIVNSALINYLCKQDNNNIPQVIIKKYPDVG